ncbi:MAG: hypothetical protein DME61_06020 [Verrucomicrobia bacterium]|nr:MAG: hypothetical protein DME61_06020 [Verrucomicrobiota bacterium]PYL69635.1 MAG: hypothetical protein DMF28_02575 [Verrucomicrobiota bacterium]
MEHVVLSKCSGSDKTVQNLTDYADRNRADQSLRKKFSGCARSVCTDISLVSSRSEKRESVLLVRKSSKRLTMAQMMLKDRLW